MLLDGLEQAALYRADGVLRPHRHRLVDGRVPHVAVPDAVARPFQLAVVSRRAPVGGDPADHLGQLVAAQREHQGHTVRPVARAREHDIDGVRAERDVPEQEPREGGAPIAPALQHRLGIDPAERTHVQPVERVDGEVSDEPVQHHARARPHRRVRGEAG